MSQRITSFSELASKMGRPARPGPADPPDAADTGGPLRVRFELAAGAGPPALHECRSIVLKWAEDALGGSLPRKAWRMRPFELKRNDVECRAVRVRDAQRDQWALRIARTPRADMEVCTEVVVGSVRGRTPAVSVELHDKAVVPADLAAHYPAALVAGLNERAPLFRNGRRVAHTPIVIESDDQMAVFLRSLLNPDRERPLAALTIDPEDDRQTLAPQWDLVARSLAGLAVTWVLTPAMTFRLSDTVGKPLSAFLGAWRFYKPGFDRLAGQREHPLVLKRRILDDRGVQEAVRGFVRMAVAVRRSAARDAEAAADAGAAAETHGVPSYEVLARESRGAARGPGRLLLLLRDTFRRGAPGREPQGEAEPVSAQAGPPPAALARPGAGAVAAVSEPAAPPAVRAPQATTKPASRARAVPQPDRGTRIKLQRVRQKAERRQEQYEHERERANRAERERDELSKRVEQLEELVRTLGGDPDASVPFPTAWDEFPAWCGEHLGSRVALAPMAVREVGRAQFRDVPLAARCLIWLATDYRDGRTKGGNPSLWGRIDSLGAGIFNAPCGGDSFDHPWEGRTERVEWHIKGGANTRDPKRCLRIYYFWDDAKNQVVVASMPAHRKTALS